VIAGERIPGYRIEGHAIVSADEGIAGPDGQTPLALSNEADWLRFQAALDGAAVVLIGRRSHEANPNRGRRNRLVVSSSATGIERRSEAWWWNPAEAPLTVALKRAAPEGGIVAVPGGHLVFDLLLKIIGFDAFHLARVRGVLVPGGMPLFSAIEAGWTAADVLAGSGLRPGPTEILDEQAGVTLVTWLRAAG
jgi:hypothetical protein